MHIPNISESNYVPCPIMKVLILKIKIQNTESIIALQTPNSITLRPAISIYIQPKLPSFTCIWTHLPMLFLENLC